MPSEVMSKQARMQRFLARKPLLAVGRMAAVVALIAIGLLNAPAGSAQSQESFDVASVKLNKNGGRRPYPGLAADAQPVAAAEPPLRRTTLPAHTADHYA